MKIQNRDIYEQIGNLFYSIVVDQRIKPLEIAELKLLISKDWLPVGTGKKRSAVSDETHSILTTMDANEAKQLSALEAFREFSQFFRKNSEHFTSELRKRILHTAMEITNVFKADNLNENIHLNALKELLYIANVQEV